MALGNFTRQVLENTAADRWSQLVAAVNDLAELDGRAAAELAAGTLDQDDFYGGPTPDTEDKNNILGALDTAAAIHAWLFGKGQVAAPAGDPLGYAKFLLGT